jgi:ferredoxin
MIVEVKSHEYLTDFLRRSGQEMATACSLHKGCGKCKVKLLSGIWESGGKILPSPGTAVACVTRLKSCIGTIEIPDAEPALPQVLQEWQGTMPLPSLPEPVIAVDMGSTTLAAVRIENGRITATGCMNVGGRLLKFDAS